ncbi:hypothetical protein WICMUC_005863 [Wickerhamomyces mucosus]|uniref:COP9 signalosome complex subunit 5 n=1 Tax=Wickerhamomyces mucosus TaxID=1378264 RepID=A0A9P8P2L1_9ASCO|nr:hypothetical protein WICMUC_005863 [Wickerhamomyces mucosus]
MSSSSSSSILNNINPLKDGGLIGHFCNHSIHKDKNNEEFNNNEQQHQLTEGNSNENQQNNQSSLNDTIDISTILNLPLTERSKFFYDEIASDQRTALLNSMTPWIKDPNYFQTAHISSLALLKMSIHARSGGSIEIMGMLTGKIVKNGIVIMDVYPLPVEGTETRVNAQAEGYEFMVDYLDSLKKLGRNENIVGWYHSHPGYGCWLSGIDVSTQSLNQQFQDPYLAIVIDPERTISKGKVEIGAFRTYPKDYIDNKSSINSLNTNLKNDDNLNLNKNKSIPQDKIKDFGLHSSQYYSLNVEIFRSELENSVLQNLWNKFWVSQFVGNDNNIDNNDNDGKFESQDLTNLISEKLNELTFKIDNFNKTDSINSKHKNSISIETSSHGIISTPNNNNNNNSNNNPLSILENTQLSPFTRNNFFAGSTFVETNTDEIRFKKELESDIESDSEMNDDSNNNDNNNDSDSQFGEDLSVQQIKFRKPTEVTTNQVRNILKRGTTRKLKTSIQGQEQEQEQEQEQSLLSSISNSPSNSNSQKLSSNKENDELEKSLKNAAKMSRELMNLKLQEILFLNE